jgi:peptidoglycan hydrolase-like protein with peptidoglycan-binding domain
MFRSHAVTALLAFGSLAALPACTMNSGHPSGTAYMAPMATPELSPGMVRQVQTSLQQQGIYQGNIDGLWGPATQSAVQSYQQLHGLTASGQLNSTTLASLNLPDTGAAAATQPAAAAPAAAAPAAPAPAPVSSAAPPATTSTTAATTPAAATTP